MQAERIGIHGDEGNSLYIAQLSYYLHDSNKSIVTIFQNIQKPLLPLLLLAKGSILNLTEKIFDITKFQSAVRTDSTAKTAGRNPVKPPKIYSSNNKKTLKSTTLSLPVLTQPGQKNLKSNVQSSDTRSITTILSQSVSR